MRRFFVMASLLVLSACGGQPGADESSAEQAPVADEVSATSQYPTGCTSGNSWECFCAQFKTFDTCRAQRSCVWAYNKCSPTYE